MTTGRSAGPSRSSGSIPEASTPEPIVMPMDKCAFAGCETLPRTQHTARILLFGSPVVFSFALCESHADLVDGGSSVAKIERA